MRRRWEETLSHAGGQAYSCSHVCRQHEGQKKRRFILRRRSEWHKANITHDRVRRIIDRVTWGSSAAYCLHIHQHAQIAFKSTNATTWRWDDSNDSIQTNFTRLDLRNDLKWGATGGAESHMQTWCAAHSYVCTGMFKKQWLNLNPKPNKPKQTLGGFFWVLLHLRSNTGL